MATRCVCRWVPVSLHPDLDTVLLRAEEVPGCPAHATVHEQRPAAA
jgi:hypothetical protein